MARPVCISTPSAPRHSGRSANSLMSENLPQKQSPRVVLRACGLAVLTVLALPFLYLTTVALLLSAYVHNFPLPSRGFLKAYAIPSNRLVELPVVGGVCSNYCQLCIKITGANQESQRKDQNRMGSSNAR